MESTLASCEPVRPLWRCVLDDELLTRGLNDPEAHILVEWLVECTDALAKKSATADLPAQARRLHVRARAISRFVYLWCHAEDQAAAIQLLATQRFTWPLPTDWLDPYDLMAGIISWEDGRGLA